MVNTVGLQQQNQEFPSSNHNYDNEQNIDKAGWISLPCDCHILSQHITKETKLLLEDVPMTDVQLFVYTQE